MSNSLVRIDVRGRPRAQGSMRLLSHGKGIYSDNVIDWRNIVAWEVKRQAKGVHLAGPIGLHLSFDLPRPQSHYLKGKKTLGQLSPQAPIWPARKPDLDKLTRAICDAVTDAGLWHDDSQVCFIHTTKRYAAEPGVLITVRRL